MYRVPSRARRRTRLHALPALLGVLLALGLGLSFGVPRVHAAASYPVTGTAYRDYNANGKRDLREPGVAGITVTATTYTSNAAGNEIVANTYTAVTGATGTYSITIVDGNPARIEFGALDTARNFKFNAAATASGFKAGVSGTGTGATGRAGDDTTVAFVDASINAGAPVVDLGLNRPSQYCQAAANITLVSCVYQQGPVDATNDATAYTTPELYSFNYNNNGNTNGMGGNPNTQSSGYVAPTGLTEFGKLGSVFGLAYQRLSNKYFTAALMKRHTGFGPGGTGAIYLIDPTNTNIATNSSIFLNLATLTGAPAGLTGTDPHANITTNTDYKGTVTSPTPYYYDDGNAATTAAAQGIFQAVGKISLGGLKLYEDDVTGAQYLYTVNLTNQHLYQIPIGSTSTPTAPTNFSQIVDSALPALPTGTTCNGTIRPFGIGFNDGVGYLGAVCDATGSNTTADLKAFVYTFNPTTGVFNLSGGNAVLALNIPLNYTRGCVYNGTCFTVPPTGTGGHSANWEPWQPDFLPTDSQTNGVPQPEFTSIAFDNGQMIIGLRDRYGDQGGHSLGGTDVTNTTGYEVVSAGDILRASNNGDGTWTLESAGKANVTNAAGTTAVTTGGSANTQGPGGGEYYYNENYVGGHDETALGGLAQVPGLADVVTTAFDPSVNYRTGGVAHFYDDNTVGTVAAKNIGYELYGSDAAGTSGKAGGIGDLVANCSAAPIEVGSRVFYDPDRSGLQEAYDSSITTANGAKGIVGVTVHLYAADGTTLLGTAITDAKGNYYFTSDVAATTDGRGAGTGTTSTASLTYVAGLTANTAFIIKFDNSANYQPGGALYQAASNGATASPLQPTTAFAGGGTSPNTDPSAIDSKEQTFGANFTDSGTGISYQYSQIPFTTGAAGTNNHTLDAGFNTPTAAGPTAARVSYVRSSVNGNQATIEWAAAREYNALGYTIVAANGQRLTAHIVPAYSLLNKPDGLYRETVTLPAGVRQFTIVDVAPGGATVAHGPYTIGQTYSRAPSYAQSDRTPATTPARNTATATIALAQTEAALVTNTAGMYHLTIANLTAQGLDFTGVKPASLGLTNNGASVPLRVKTAKSGVFGPNDYIEFNATAVDTFYSGTNTYVLTSHAKTTNQVETLPDVTDAVRKGSIANVTFPGRGYYWDEAPAKTSPWTWALLENDIAADADQTVHFDLPGLDASSQKVTVTLHLRGWGGYHNGKPDHHAIADLAGAHGEATFANNDSATITLTLPANKLAATGNSLRLRAPGDLGVQYDTMILETIAVSYPQTALPAQTSLPAVRAFTRATDLQASISQQAGGTALDYLVIAPSDFAAGAAQIAQYHRTQDSFRTATVDVQAVYDSYSGGIVDPAAIQKFIAAMKAQRGVQYVLLVGADSYDPRGYLAGDAPSFIPAFRAPDSFGVWSPSDSAFADTNGNGLPDIALGRLPVRTTAELAALIAKITAFGTGSTSPSATFVTDPTDATFAAISAADANALPAGAQVTQLTWQPGNAAPATQSLIAQWQAGSRLISYTGHSNADLWADDVVLDTTSLGSLANSKPALLSVWGCWAATYDRAGLESLSQSLLGLANGGAVGVIAESTLVTANQHGPMAAAFYRALYANGTPARVGIALMQAKSQILAAHPDWQDTAAGLMLLGDPAGHI